MVAVLADHYPFLNDDRASFASGLLQDAVNSFTESIGAENVIRGESVGSASASAQTSFSDHVTGPGSESFTPFTTSVSFRPIGSLTG